MSRAGDWSLNPIGCSAHSQMATSFACSSRCRQSLNISPRMLANQMRAVPANYELHPPIISCTHELRPPSSDSLASAVLIVIFISTSKFSIHYQEQSTKVLTPHSIYYACRNCKFGVNNGPTGLMR